MEQAISEKELDIQVKILAKRINDKHWLFSKKFLHPKFNKSSISPSLFIPSNPVSWGSAATRRLINYDSTFRYLPINASATKRKNFNIILPMVSITLI